MNAFDPHYVGRIASDAASPRGRQALEASRKASALVEAMRSSDDPYQRHLASGCIPGLGETQDLAKTNRILKISKL